MQTLQLFADVSLPGYSGARTTDICAIHKNILIIQQALGEKFYSPGDMQPANVLVVKGVYDYVCVINLRLFELNGYMSFINAQKTEMQALGIFQALCQSRPFDPGEIEDRFITTYRQVKKQPLPYSGSVAFKSKLTTTYSTKVY